MRATIRIDNNRACPLVAFKCTVYFYNVFQERMGKKEIRKDNLSIPAYGIGYITFNVFSSKVHAMELHNVVVVFSDNEISNNYPDVYPVLTQEVYRAPEPEPARARHAENVDTGGASGWRRMAREAGVDDSHYNSKYYKKDYNEE